MSSLGLHALSPMLMMPYTPTPGPYFDSLLATPGTGGAIAAGATAGTSAAAGGPEASPIPLAHHASYRHTFQHHTPGGVPPIEAFQLPPTALPSNYPSEALRYPPHPHAHHPAHAAAWRVSAASPALPPPTPGPAFLHGLPSSDPHMQQLHSSFSRMSLSNYPSAPNIPAQNRRQPLNGRDPTASPPHHDANGVGSPEQTQRSPPTNGADPEWIHGNRRDTGVGRKGPGPYGRHQPSNDYMRMHSPAYMYQQSPGGPHMHHMGRIPPSHVGGSLGGGRPHMNGVGGPRGGGRHGPGGGAGYPPQRPGGHDGPYGGGPPPHMMAGGGSGGHGPNAGPPGTGEYHIDDLSELVPDPVAKYATTQYGSRALQVYVVQSDENFRMVFDAVSEPFSRLMVDLFGNYLCQKVLQKCNSTQLSSTLKRLQKEIPAVSCDRQGTCVMQRITQHAEEDKQVLWPRARRSGIPISAQLQYNIDVLCEYICTRIPVHVREFSSKQRLSIIGSFDVNKPGLSTLYRAVSPVAR